MQTEKLSSPFSHRLSIKACGSGNKAEGMGFEHHAKTPENPDETVENYTKPDALCFPADLSVTSNPELCEHLRSVVALYNQADTETRNSILAGLGRLIGEIASQTIDSASLEAIEQSCRPTDRKDTPRR